MNLAREQKYVFIKKVHTVKVIINEHYVHQNPGNASTVETVKYQDSNIVSFMLRGKILIGNPRPSIHLSSLDFFVKKERKIKP
jgi:hypothetical protein